MSIIPLCTRSLVSTHTLITRHFTIKFQKSHVEGNEMSCLGLAESPTEVYTWCIKAPCKLGPHGLLVSDLRLKGGKRCLYMKKSHWKLGPAGTHHTAWHHIWKGILQFRVSAGWVSKTSPPLPAQAPIPITQRSGVPPAPPQKGASDTARTPPGDHADYLPPGNEQSLAIRC